jgi:hypothetical protein
LGPRFVQRLPEEQMPHRNANLKSTAERLRSLYCAYDDHASKALNLIAGRASKAPNGPPIAPHQFI